jgi:hypothetical protein
MPAVKGRRARTPQPANTSRQQEIDNERRRKITAEALDGARQWTRRTKKTA